MRDLKRRLVDPLFEEVLLDRARYLNHFYPARRLGADRDALYC